MYFDKVFCDSYLKGGKKQRVKKLKTNYKSLLLYPRITSMIIPIRGVFYF